MSVDDPHSAFGSNPFPGLRPFSTDEDHLFFGRDEQTAALLRLLREHQFLAVVGTSGSGKSSLVRAGLIPALHRGSMVKAGAAWEVVVLRPGGNPIASLAGALIDGGLYDGAVPGEAERLRATLTRSLFGLVEAVRQSPNLDPGSNLLVVVDQFEELFRFRRQGTASQEAAAAFVKLVLAASSSPDLPAAPDEEGGAGKRRIYVLITMRSDYLGDCSQIPGLAEAVNRGEYLIPRLTRDQRRAAIEMPVGVGGARIASRLVQQMLNDLGDEADQLPVLQHALMRTWDVWAADHADGEPLDLRHYESTGGMAEALSRHADEVLANLDSAFRIPHSAFSSAPSSLCERIFKALTVKGSDNRGIRRPTRLDRLALIAGAGEAETAAVVEAFRRPGVTFLMPGAQTPLASDTVVDLSHESLMRIWRRLAAWVEEEAQSARIYRRLSETAALWQKDQAGLYRDPDLQIALSWRESVRPTSEWGEQYGGGFDASMSFLEQSREAAEAEERAREEARKRELEQARRLAEVEGRRLAAERRARKRTSALAVVLMAVAALAVGAFFYALEARRQAVSNADLAQEKEKSATRAAAELRSTLVANDLEQGAQRIEEGSAADGLAYLSRALRTDPTFWPAGALALKTLASGRFFLTSYPVIRQEQPISHFLPDDDRDLIFTSDTGASTGTPERLVWDGRSGARLCELAKEVKKILISPESWGTGKDRFIGLDVEKGIIRSWAIPSGKEGPPISPEGFADFKTARHPKAGPLVLGQHRDGWVQVFKPNGEAATPRLEHAGSSCDGLGFLPGAKSVFAAYADGTIEFWETEGGAPASRTSTKPYRPAADAAGGIGFTSDGETMVCRASGGRRAQWFRPGEPAPAGEWIELPDPSDLVFLPGGSKIAFVTRIQEDRPVAPVVHASVYELASRKRTALLETPSDRRVSQIFYPEEDGHVLRYPLVGLIFANIVRVWDLEAGSLLREFFALGILDWGAFSPEGRRVLTSSVEHEIMLWDLFSYPGNQLLSEAIRSSGNTSHAFSPDGENLLISDGENRLHRLWNSRSGLRLKEPFAMEGFSSEVHFDSRKGQMLLYEHGATQLGSFSRTTIGQARILHLNDRPAIPETIVPAGGGTARAVFTPGGRDLVVCGKERPADPAELLVLDTSTRRVRLAIPLPPGISFHNRSLEVSGDGKLATLASSDRLTRIWDLGSGALLHELPQHEEVTETRFSPDGSRVATGTFGGKVRIWDVKSGAPLSKTIDLGERPIMAIAFSPDGRYLATAAADGDLMILDGRTGEEEQVVPLNRHILNGLDFTPDGAHLAVVAFGNEALIVETAAGKVERKLQNPDACRSVRFSPDGLLLAVGFGGYLARPVGGVQLWNWREGSAVGSPLDTRGSVGQLEFSADGALLAASTVYESGGSALAWEVQSRRQVSDAAVERSAVGSISFNPGGTELAAAWEDGTVRIVDLPPHGASQPPWLARLSEAVARKKMAGGQAGIQPVPPEELFEVRKELLAQASPSTGSSGDTAGRWGRWIATDPVERSISPASGVSLADHLALLHRSKRVEDLQEALLLAPADAIAHGRMGLVLLDLTPATWQTPIPAQFGSEPLLRRHWQATADWYSRRALELDDRDPEVWALRAEMLLRRGRREEAAAASARALDLGTGGAASPTVNARYLQAASLAGQGKWGEADAAMEKTLAALSASGGSRRRAPLLSNLEDLEPARAPGGFREIRLPPPIPGTFEDFENAPEGGLPPGWKATGESLDPPVPASQHLRLDESYSQAFEGWTVVSLSQKTATVNTPFYPSRLLRLGGGERINGRFPSSLFEGRFLYSTTGDRDTSSLQVVETPDFDCSGRTGVHVSYHSGLEQADHSLTGLEYSIDGGKSWLGVRYRINAEHVVRDESRKVDAQATLQKRWQNFPLFIGVGGSVRGGTYGEFLGAKIDRALDGAIEGLPWSAPQALKRVDLFRLPAADGQKTVRVRFIHFSRLAWYWAIDDFGLYQIPEDQGAPPAADLLDRTRDPEALAAAGLRTLLGSDPRPSWSASQQPLSVFGLEAASPLESAEDARALIERRVLDARLFIQRAAALSPGDPALLLPLALAQARSGDPAAGMESARKLLARRPLSFGDGFPLALVFLIQGEALQAKGDADSAAALFDLSEMMARRSAAAMVPGVLRRSLAAKGLDTPGNVFLPQGSEWAYFDEGRSPGAAWKQPDFDDRSWQRGKARLGYGGDGEVTVVRFGPDSKKKYMTTYFRAGFDCPAPQATLRLSVQRDDGVAVYLNGQEIARDNLPSGEIRLDTLAIEKVNSQEDEQRFVIFDIPSDFLRIGRNVVAAEVHQQDPTSTDLGFDLRLEGRERPKESRRPDPDIAAAEERLELPPWLRGGLWAFRAERRRAVGEGEGAVQALERAATLAPDNPAIPYERAFLLKPSNEEAAFAEFQKAVEGAMALKGRPRGPFQPLLPPTLRDVIVPILKLDGLTLAAAASRAAGGPDPAIRETEVRWLLRWSESLDAGGSRARLERAEALGILGKSDEALEAAEAAIGGGEPPGGSPPRLFREYRDWLYLEERLFRNLGRTGDEERARALIFRPPPRDPKASPRLIDLGPHYNISPYQAQSWHSEVDLRYLPETFRPQGGINFDIRGIVQLNSGTYSTRGASIDRGNDLNQFVMRSFPDQVAGILVGLETRALHFLVASIHGRPPRDGTVLARMVIHYLGGGTAEVPLLMGEDLTDWAPDEDRPYSAKVAWYGARPPRVIFEKVWRNPQPALRIDSIDFVSAKAEAGPFLLAITAE